MKATVNVSPEILNWIIAQIPVESLSKKAADYLNDWLQGKLASLKEIETVSKATGIPFGYFFLKYPPKEDLSIIEYRTVDSTHLNHPSRNLIDVKHDMEMVQLWMHDHLVSEKVPPLNYVGCLKQVTGYTEIAKTIRNILLLKEDWFTDSKDAAASFKALRKAISDSGTIVMMSGIVKNNTKRTLSVDEFRAFTLIDKYIPLIFINSNDSPNGRVFSLLHEFAHICLGENSFFNYQYDNNSKISPTETVCNRAAAEILVPDNLFIQEWYHVRTANTLNDTLTKLAHYFKCSISVIARKACDHEFIGYAYYVKLSESIYKNFKDSLKDKKPPQGGGDFYHTIASRIDHRFFKTLVNSVNEGTTLHSEAFRLTNTNSHSFRKLVQTMEGK